MLAMLIFLDRIGNVWVSMETENSAPSSRLIHTLLYFEDCFKGGNGELACEKEGQRGIS